MLKDYIVGRLREPSTYRGLFMLAGALGVTLSPEQQTAIITLVMAAVGVVGVFLPDGKKF